MPQLIKAGGGGISVSFWVTGWTARDDWVARLDIPNDDAPTYPERTPCGGGVRQSDGEEEEDRNADRLKSKLPKLPDGIVLPAEEYYTD
ncbi:hypothetical protein LSH36_58g12027 [Paralvinella palmiformis]|uniref:Uncharacterized protein n=1 Tax=Paralvinella palmiformis TaxID=53620 RepID=A0AAD9K5M4_9ANNE|nr:hypothetical protein LSH36_58g12027 [Paralvinella palmiformis]